MLFASVGGAAQQNGVPPPVHVIDGPAAPAEPNGMARDEATGKSTIRAIKLREPLRLDGKLDESIYEETKGFGGMLQASPRYGQPSTERTEIWVLFDGDNIYVAARCWDTAPPEKWVANELRRDTNQMRQNDHFGVGFDTFYDRRSGYMFYANPLGGFSDYSVIDEGAPNSDWNPVWSVRTGRFEGGWTLEMAFPFKSLRYTSGSDQVWGIQFRRSIRHKNEWTYWTPVPQNMAGPQALNRVSAFGTVVGLDLPAAGRNIELKPYALGKMTTDRIANPPTSNDNDGDLGGDLKYGVTANLTADLTVNTDFAQVEIDEQQVNLTRFNLFLPEKREFFLEGRGLFDFGRGGAAGVAAAYRVAVSAARPTCPTCSIAGASASTAAASCRSTSAAASPARSAGGALVCSTSRPAMSRRRRHRPRISPWPASSATSCAAALSARCSPIATT